MIHSYSRILSSHEKKLGTELKGKNKGRCAAGNMITQGLPRDEFQHKVHVGCTQAISFRSL